MNLIPTIFLVALGAVAAAAMAAFNRADDPDIREQGVFVLFTAKRAQYNRLGWRALIVARTLGLLALLLLVAQVVLAFRAGQ